MHERNGHLQFWVEYKILIINYSCKNEANKILTIVLQSSMHVMQEMEMLSVIHDKGQSTTPANHPY